MTGFPILPTQENPPRTCAVTENDVVFKTDTTREELSASISLLSLTEYSGEAYVPLLIVRPFYQRAIESIT